MKLVFDIETVRAYDNLEDAPKAYDDAWCSFSKKKFPDMGHLESYKQKAALYPEFGKIVVISAISSEEKQVVSLSGEGENKEYSLLKDFAAALNTSWANAQLIGHYIKGFDIPYIVTRMAANGIAIPKILKLYGQKPWEMNLIDTYDVWRSGLFNAPNAASLDCVCMVLGIESPKQEINGSQVSDVYYSDDPKAMQTIITYCEADTKATAAVVNKMVQLRMI